MNIPRVVIDTNVLIAALRSRRGASSRLLQLLGTNLFDIHLSVAMVLEYEYVILRQRNLLGLSQEDVDSFIDAVCAVGVHQNEIHFRWRPQLRDADDEFVLEAAIAGQCRYIVTFNVRDFVGVRRFGIEPITPAEFLKRLGVDE